jgi:hypothetical protein
MLTAATTTRNGRHAAARPGTRTVLRANPLCRELANDQLAFCDAATGLGMMHLRGGDGDLAFLVRADGVLFAFTTWRQPHPAASFVVSFTPEGLRCRRKKPACQADPFGCPHVKALMALSRGPRNVLCRCQEYRTADADRQAA